MNPAFLIAGTHSGCGKTTVTLGVMAALRKKGLTVQPFKCGPDFIDPTLHRLVTGKVSRNLDLWMCGHNFVKSCFAKYSRDADIAVVEGVMGLFDGNESSSAALAKVLGLPVVLVVDARSTAESMAAVVKGFESRDPAVNLAGVILNRVGSDRHLELLTTAIREHCRADILGYLPREVEFSIPDRHLGLHMGDDDPISQEALDKLAVAVTEHIDLDRLGNLTVANGGDCFSPEERPDPVDMDVLPSDKVRIGVARDRAFCFYYEDNLDLLVRAGAEIVEFSPLTNHSLPENLQGIYLGGGYPELYADQLSVNSGMCKSVQAWADAGKPVYAECGGFMYLTEGITDTAGKFYPLAGVFPVKARMKKGRVALGYRQAKLMDDSMLGLQNTNLRGHEFHYSEIDEMPDSVMRNFLLADGRHEGYRTKNTLGSYLHLHFGFNPQGAESFVQFCMER
ncbi:MAG: cobyrinate a,c-diamide synthase [Thermodesulfobacteriota bacterium]